MFDAPLIELLTDELHLLEYSAHLFRLAFGFFPRYALLSCCEALCHICLERCYLNKIILLVYLYTGVFTPVYLINEYRITD